MTFFKREFGLCVIRAPHLKKNLYAQEVQTESIDAYRQGRINLEDLDYTIKAIVLDGRPGVRQLFSDVPSHTDVSLPPETDHYPLSD